MFRFAVLVISGVVNFVNRAEFVSVMKSLCDDPILDGMIDSVETFEFPEGRPEATVEDFKLWKTELINYRDHIRRNDSGFVCSDGELFIYEFDACKYEQELWAENDRVANLTPPGWDCVDADDFHDSFHPPYEELEREDAERDYHFNTMDYLD